MADAPYMETEQPTQTMEAADAPVMVTQSSGPSDTALYEWVMALKDEAAKARRDLAADDQWDDWQSGFWGDQWPSDLPTFKLPIVLNELKKTIFEEISDLTDSKIMIYVMRQQQAPNRDDRVERSLQAFWKRALIDQEVMSAAINAAIYPAGFLTCLWDPYAMDGQGDIIVRSRDPRSVYPDADAEDDDHWRYVILEDVLDVADIRRLWPVNGWRVKPDGRYSVKSRQEQKSGPGAGHPYYGPLYEHGGFPGMVQGWKKARAAVTYCWVYDDALEEQVVETQGQPLRMAVRKKYPNGRLIIVSNGVKLYDDANPYWGRFPVVRTILQPSPNAFWPQSSFVGELLDAQRAANKFESQVYENAVRLNNGTLVADSNSGVDPQTFLSIPGQVLLKTPGSQVQIQYPSPMPPDMVQAGPRMRQFIREQLGFTPARTGLGTRGNVSPELTETEISQSMGLTRLHARLLFVSVQKLVEMVFWRMAQFYVIPRHIPYIHDDQWQPVAWEPIANARDYAIHVDPSSFQVKSKTMMQRLYLLLARLNKIDDETLLSGLEVPNATEIARKTKEQLALMAQANMLKKKRGGK